MIKQFFENGNNEFYPFENISEEKWGLDLLPKGVENV